MTSHTVSGRLGPDDFAGKAETDRERDERSYPSREHDRQDLAGREDTERLERDESRSEEKS